MPGRVSLVSRTTSATMRLVTRRWCSGSSSGAASGGSQQRQQQSARRIIHSPVPDIPASELNSLLGYPSLTLSRVDEAPNRPALIDVSARTENDDGGSHRVLTLADVRDLSLNAAGGLARHGIVDGAVLALFLHNCLEFVLAQLGGMIAGATLTLANPNFTASELAYQLRHSGAVAVVTQADKFEIAAKAAKEAGCVKDIYVVDKLMSGAHHFDELLVDSDGPRSLDDWQLDPSKRVAILPYSSGTTGLPKGVQLSHSNICINLLQYNRTVRPPVMSGPYLGVLPFYHIYGQAMVGQALHTGCATVLMRKFEPENFLRAVEEHGINVMHLVPPLVLFLLQHPLSERYNLSSVRQIYSAAAPLGPEIQLRLVDMFKTRYGVDIELQQLYGLTETSPITHGPQPLGERPASTLGQIGAPVCNQLTRVVNVVTGQDVGPGQEGELVVKGPQVMLGYLNNEKATRDCIREDGWFHTGDIAVYDEFGYFKIVDRVKELIKVKGSQVAPAELEDILLNHPSVQDCAIIGRPDERAGELPCAFVVPRPGVQLTAEEVKSYVADRVTKYKRLDGGVVFTDSIPRNPSGKILRRFLRDSLH
ncbi:hypothetical protein BOX15_Mlig034233g3 [Macrostomum lignano]|uniref:4-coumarate--CoA ligase n=1 Tax=Macrostomum lignano TaxID=282301 RepID=A0A267FD42_9PLAT|nr:hypothetical protein BOX15_Mlig034233g3 [Macrostomum lignano]